MSGFLNIRNSRLEESCKKVFLTVLQNSLKNIENIRDAVYNLRFQAKGLKLFWRETPDTCFPKNFAEVLRTPILQNADRLLVLKHLRMRISCFLILKFWQILWKTSAMDFTTVGILQVIQNNQSRSLCVGTDNNLITFFTIN